MISNTFFMTVFILLFAGSVVLDYRNVKQKKSGKPSVAMLVTLNVLIALFMLMVLSGTQPVMPSRFLVKQAAPPVQAWLEEVGKLGQVRR